MKKWITATENGKSETASEDCYLLVDYKNTNHSGVATLLISNVTIFENTDTDGIGYHGQFLAPCAKGDVVTAKITKIGKEDFMTVYKIPLK